MPCHSSAYSQIESIFELILIIVYNRTHEKVYTYIYIISFLPIFTPAVSHHSFFRYEIQLKMYTFTQHLLCLNCDIVNIISLHQNVSVPCSSNDAGFLLDFDHHFSIVLWHLIWGLICC